MSGVSSLFSSISSSTTSQVAASILVGLVVGFLGVAVASALMSKTASQVKDSQSKHKEEKKDTVMLASGSSSPAPFAAPNDPLPPPGNRVFSPEELARYDGSTEDTPIYLAVKGVVFDVSRKRDMYGVGAGYHVFVGKDASKALGMGSLNPADCIADHSSLTPQQFSIRSQEESIYRIEEGISAPEVPGNCFVPDDLSTWTHQVDSLAALDSWDAFYRKRYPIVGTLRS